VTWKSKLSQIKGEKSGLCGEIEAHFKNEISLSIPVTLRGFRALLG
jgi:hypothetical protein